MPKTRSRGQRRATERRPTKAKVERPKLPDWNLPSWAEREDVARELNHAADVIGISLGRLLEVTQHGNYQHVMRAAALLHRYAVGHQIQRLSDRIKRLEQLEEERGRRAGEAA